MCMNMHACDQKPMSGAFLNHFSMLYFRQGLSLNPMLIECLDCLASKLRDPLFSIHLLCAGISSMDHCSRHYTCYESELWSLYLCSKHLTNWVIFSNLRINFSTIIIFSFTGTQNTFLLVWHLFSFINILHIIKYIFASLFIPIYFIIYGVFLQMRSFWSFPFQIVYRNTNDV